ncbi:hypothetical protein [Thalassococcus lentus]|uniref:Uncharacterized protein n=1 Tax=Thalassococcus lentus TaxID=1210524 RepID=A0ABT4XPL0_9RHOB|nr:hypothetical protein [Thalassococcus lentus]MDA7423891.1 hypothetical protein [Thalassococcus lentus]
MYFISAPVRISQDQCDAQSDARLDLYHMQVTAKATRVMLGTLQWI